MNTKRNKAIIVDDKIRPRSWGIEALENCGFKKENITEASYGDDCLSKYHNLIADGNIVDIILSDQHMDVRRKPPQGISCKFKNATIFSGIDLAQAIFKVNPDQKFCLISAGLNDEILDRGFQTGINLILYKRRPEDKKFSDYTKIIDGYIDGNIDPYSFKEQLPSRIRHLNDSMIQRAIEHNL